MSSNTFSSRNGVSDAGTRVASENVQAPALTVSATELAANTEPASRRIRRAHQILGDLLLADDFEHEHGLLIGVVAEQLNRILLELDQMSGLQRMFELWVQDAP